MAPASGENMAPTAAKRQTRVSQWRGSLKRRNEILVLVALEGGPGELNPQVKDVISESFTLPVLVVQSEDVGFRLRVPG